VYLCQHIADDVNDSGHNVVQTVFAQCGAMYKRDGPEELRCVGETEFVQGIVAMSNAGIYGDARLCTGIFGTADLQLGAAVEPVLLAHIGASANFRGIRSGFPADLDATFQEGFRMLAKHNLAFDNYSPDYERLPALAKLAAAHPTVPVIVNHLGGKIDPAMDDAEFSKWQACIDAVAAVPNCVIKCGGAQQRVGADWEPPFHMHKRESPIGSEELCDLLFRFYSYAIDKFGADRCECAQAGALLQWFAATRCRGCDWCSMLTRA
jgi:L-fuconolactonase